MFEVSPITKWSGEVLILSISVSVYLYERNSCIRYWILLDITSAMHIVTDFRLTDFLRIYGLLSFFSAISTFIIVFQ